MTLINKVLCAALLAAGAGGCAPTVSLNDRFGKAYREVMAQQAKERLTRDPKGFDGQDAVLAMSTYRAMMGQLDAVPKNLRQGSGKGEPLNIGAPEGSGMRPHP